MERVLMPKIRGVKPDYWTDEDIVELSIPARLLFIGLWNYACDNGHLQDKPKQIKMRVLPGDDVNCSELLRELAAKKRIQRADGWITVPNLGAHQKIDVRYFTTCDKEGCVDPPEKVSQRAARRAHDGHTSGTRVRTPGARGDGEVMVKGSDGDRSAPRAAKRATQLPNDWTPNDQHKGFAAENLIDLAVEADSFRDHHRAKGSTMKDWDAAFRGWLRNVVKWRKGTPAAPQPAKARPHASQLELPPDGLTPEQYAAWERGQRAKRGAP